MMVETAGEEDERTHGERTALVLRGLRLEYATLAWNVVGCWIVLAAAYVARSVALVGLVSTRSSRPSPALLSSGS
jgi:hypothetical protein